MHIWFGDYLHRIYQNELEVKDTTDTQKSASYLDLHLDKNDTVVITIRLTLRNIHISNDNGSFTLYVDVFSLYHCQYFYRTWLFVYTSNAASRAPDFTTHFLVGSMLLIFLVFCDVLLCVFKFWVPCCDVRYDLRIKTMFGSSLPPVVCRKGHALFTLFVFVCV